jgi:hypothetical protein
MFEAAFDMFFHGFLHLCSLYDTYSGSLCSPFCAHSGRIEAIFCFYTYSGSLSSAFFLFSGSLCPIVLQILKQPLMLIARNPAAFFLFLKTYSGSLYAAFSCFRATFFQIFLIFWQPFFLFLYRFRHLGLYFRVMFFARIQAVFDPGFAPI